MNPPDITRLVVICAAAIAMLVGMGLVFYNLNKNNHGFGPNSLKALGLVSFLPTLLIVSVALPDFKPEVLSTLLGTVAGYVLSNSKEEEKKSPQSRHSGMESGNGHSESYKAQ